MPLNPCRREYPRNYINTGISAIDGLTTLIRGQKLPIFSGNGLPHDELAAQLVTQSSLGSGTDERFCVVFAAMGVKYDVAVVFKRNELVVLVQEVTERTALGCIVLIENAYSQRILLKQCCTAVRKSYGYPYDRKHP